MKIIVYGSKGWIGSQFMNIIKDYNVFEGKSRLNNIEDVKKRTRVNKPNTHFLLYWKNSWQY